MTRAVRTSFRRLLRLASQLALYLVGPLLASLAPLVVIPAVTARYGAEGWASVAVALSLGLAGAVIAELGWAIVGPQRVARHHLLGEHQTARELYGRALASRIVVVATLAVPVAGTSAALAPDHRPAAALLGLGVLAGALSPSWYWTGLGRPGTILLVESVPRVVLAVGAASMIALGGPIESYGAALCIAAIGTVVLSAVVSGTPAWPTRAAFALTSRTVREQSVVVIGRSITTLYRALPTALLAGAAPSAVATYGAVDRPLRMGLQFLAVLPQRLQAWVQAHDAASTRRRAWGAVVMNAALGVIAGGVVATVMPTVVAVLFTGVITVSPSLAASGGALVAAVCATRGAGLALVALDRVSTTTWAAAASAVVGLPGAVVGGIVAGAEGAMGALVVAELSGLLVQVVVLVHRGIFRRRLADAENGGML